MSAEKVKKSVRGKGTYEAVDVEKGGTEGHDRQQNGNEGTEPQRKSCCTPYVSVPYTFSVILIIDLQNKS